MSSDIHKIAIKTTQQDYRSLPTRELVELIVYEADLCALHEFHIRRLFRLAGGKWVVLAEYVPILRELAVTRGVERLRGTSISEAACDLLTDRFSNLPVENPCGAQGIPDGTAEIRQSRIDCRNYFRGLLAVLNRDLASSQTDTPTAIETRTALVIQRYVNKQFWYCLKEALRSRNPHISRYPWTVNGYKFTLWFPRMVRGAQRRAFLESEVGVPDSDAPFECERIQALIDQRFGVPSTSPFDDANGANVSIDGSQYFMHMISFDDRDGVPPQEFIAVEKAATIGQQRRAIRALGPEKLKELVVTVLENVITPATSDSAIATQFGISKGTFSRFAGRGWRRNRGPDTTNGVPDLYRNVSHLMGRTPRFVEAAKRAGVWDEVERIRQEEARPRVRSVGDGQ